jgi:cysteinyl-tRNA synthetase
MTAGSQRSPTKPNGSDSAITTPGPLFVLNITDVDDKTLAAAKEDGGSDPLQLARRYEREFWKDWDSLNCLRPHIVTRVTEHVDSHIVPFIEGLVERGMAYELIEKEGDFGDADGVYFDVRAYDEQMGHLTRYGKLAPPAAAQGMDDIFSRDNDNSEDKSIPSDVHDQTIRAKKKRDPRDFVLWKKRKKGQEALSWSSPWGYGRPGWHIECSAMIEAVQERFRDSHRFLVHAGGIDLKFPHHTNEIAQSEAYLGVGEWIPHWVHTGHLHIDGLKMSKSLKNFVSIQDFLAGRVEGNDEVPAGNELESATGDESDAVKNFAGAMESPSDDFRLWCLGLSGSYRGPATFSMTRIEEARSIRLKFLRFLLEGEDWIRSNENEEDNSLPSTKKWEVEECDLFRITDRAKRRGLSALENDLDGSTFVSELLIIIECGMKHMAKKERGPVEPIISSLREVRELLRLVGFTETTTEAGIRVGNSESLSGRVCEDSLVESLVLFRSTVRDIALDDPSIPGMKKLLALSDELRDSILPEIGVQLIDSKNEETENTWKVCVPRSPSTSDARQTRSMSDSTLAKTVDLESVPTQEFFKVGQYEGVFSEYLEDGTPTHHADGSEVSKRLRKKLIKRREKHRLRLERNQR